MTAAEIRRPHRYYLLKRLAAYWRRDFELESVWRAKREALPSKVLPQTYPLLADLESAGYAGFEDILGASEQELVDAGLSRSDAQAALLALTESAMGYTMANGRYADVEDVTLKASGLQDVGTVASAAVELGDRTTLRLKLDVTVVASNGTLDVTVQTRKDADHSWRSLGTFTQATTVSDEFKSFSGCDREVNISAVVGTAAVTFSVTGEAA